MRGPRSARKVLGRVAAHSAERKYTKCMRRRCDEMIRSRFPDCHREFAIMQCVKRLLD